MRALQQAASRIPAEKEDASSPFQLELELPQFPTTTTTSSHDALVKPKTFISTVKGAPSRRSVRCNHPIHPPSTYRQAGQWLILTTIGPSSTILLKWSILHQNGRYVIKMVDITPKWSIFHQNPRMVTGVMLLV